MLTFAFGGGGGVWGGRAEETERYEVDTRQANDKAQTIC